MKLSYLKRQRTKQLSALVKLTKTARDRHRFIPTETMLAASVAEVIVKRRKRK